MIATLWQCRGHVGLAYVLYLSPIAFLRFCTSENKDQRRRWFVLLCLAPGTEDLTFSIRLAETCDSWGKVEKGLLDTHRVHQTFVAHCALHGQCNAKAKANGKGKAKSKPLLTFTPHFAICR